MNARRSLRKARLAPFALSAALLVGAGLAALPALAGEPSCDLGECPCVQEMVASLKKRGWLGVDLDTKEKGAIVVTRVVEDSPAQKADLRAGDRLLAVNDVPYRKDSLAELDKLYKLLIADQTVTYTVQRGEKTLKVPVKLGRIPEKLMAQWIGHSILEAQTVHEKGKGGGGR